MKMLRLISGNCIHWHNKKIMVLHCTNIMVNQEYSSRIRSLRNPHWVIRFPNSLISSQLPKAYFKNTFMLQFSLFINIMKYFSFFSDFQLLSLSSAQKLCSPFFVNPHRKNLAFWQQGTSDCLLLIFSD